MDGSCKYLIYLIISDELVRFFPDFHQRQDSIKASLYSGFFVIFKHEPGTLVMSYIIFITPSPLRPCLNFDTKPEIPTIFFIRLIEQFKKILDWNIFNFLNTNLVSTCLFLQTLTDSFSNHISRRMLMNECKISVIMYNWATYKKVYSP